MSFFRTPLTAARAAQIADTVIYNRRHGQLADMVKNIKEQAALGANYIIHSEVYPVDPSVPAQLRASGFFVTERPYDKNNHIGGPQFYIGWGDHSVRASGVPKWVQETHYAAHPEDQPTVLKTAS